MGTIHEYLASLENVEWAALRPTWFMGRNTLALFPIEC